MGRSERSNDGKGPHQMIYWRLIPGENGGNQYCLPLLNGQNTQLQTVPYVNTLDDASFEDCSQVKLEIKFWD